MICPDCNKEMLVIEFKNVECDWCPDCEGYWLDKGELEIILESEDKAADYISSLENSSERGSRLCPVCSQRMKIAKISANAVEVDLCHEHGIWFEKGELQSVINSAANPKIPKLK